MPATQFDPTQLADIHLPESVSIWPIAHGWWILLGLFIFLCVLIFLFSKENKKTKHQISPKQLKNLALKELSVIEENYQADNNPHESVKQLSIFLRRFALSHYHREQVASLADEQWLALLDEIFDASHKKQIFTSEFSELLTKVPYQSTDTILDKETVNTLFTTTKKLVQNYSANHKQETKHV